MADQLSTLRVHLKQVDPGGLDELAGYAFNAAFPAYTADEEKGDQVRADVSRVLGGVAPEIDPNRPRRFAGDSSLPRACYYSIAEDDYGWDGQTLLREISAYLLGSPYPGLVSFFDNSMANDMEMLGVLADTPPANYEAIDLSVPSFLIALRPLTSDPVFHDAYGPGHVAQIPFTLTNEAIDGVVDLRRPAAQDWLVERFSDQITMDDEVFDVVLGRPPVGDFARLLPTLLDQWLGGGWSTANLTGVFARKAGAAGLVYPSARTNSSLDMRHGEVRASSGWCFVRYTPDTEMIVHAAFSTAADEWPDTAGFSPTFGSWVEEFIPLRDTIVDYVHSGPTRGSWTVTGIAEHNRAQYRLSQVSTILRSLGEEPADSASDLAYMALFSAAKDIAFLAHVIKSTLLGHAGSAATLEDMAAAAGSHFERDALTKVLAAAREVPKSFHPTGALAQAWGF